MGGEYNHSSLPDDRLYERVIHLWEHLKQKHSETRRKQLEHEFKSGVFETLTRWSEIIWLESEAANSMEEMEKTSPLLMPDELECPDPND